MIEATSIEAHASDRARTRVLPAWVAFSLVTAGVLGLYALIRAPVLNPSNYLDPWIYRALFTNFDWIFRTFPWAYYPSRLPWVIPGIVANVILPPLGAFFLLHIVFFLAGGLFAFLLFRRFFGLPVALVGYAALMFSPLFYDAHSNDYPDGAVLTYLFGALFFAVSAQGSRRRTLRFVAAGFCAAAAVGTNLFAAFAVVGIALVYFVVGREETRFAVRALADTGASLGGAALMLLGCGTFSRIHGGEFLFFMPSWRFAQQIKTEAWKRPGYAWMLQEPQLLIPLFVAVMLLILLAPRQVRRSRADAGVRLAVGAAVFLFYMIALIVVWEFAFQGDFLEVYYYYSIFDVPVALGLASALYLVMRRLPSSDLRHAWWATAPAVVAGALPIALIYGYHTGFVNAQASVFCLVIMSLAAVSAALGGLRPLGRSAAVAAAAATIVGSVFAVNYAAASGYTTGAVFGATSTFGERRATLSMAGQLIRFVQKNGMQTSVAPAFWYDNTGGTALNGIQSTYLWGITAAGFHLPHVGPPMRKLLESRRPPFVVLLCKTPGCGGGALALERAGYHLLPKAHGILAAGGRQFWVRAYRIPKFALPDALGRFYRSTGATFATTPVGVLLRRWNFAEGRPTGWTGTGVVARVAGHVTVATSKPWEYAVTSPALTLQPGHYRLFLKGTVLAGGLDLGVLDLESNAWNQQKTYWFRQKGFDRNWMVVPFDIGSTARVEFVLSNWVPHAMTSRWELRELRLTQVG